ncbi:hypothetical protein SELMODRAFT_414190 [Selaginella moellendorffii]|uniref:Gfo/Idh/MocA-like oxidoreductase N-terminal domain-containing protein n=1 Tax=Selaginella moellendorffii TaxID=88036 RepID=D8RRY3_SELML|nr:hypothetical protein SELMODRAFT_422801 [Selaginella moellendorffii]EFJ24778.1 hypothetical protein SELMODRAFT_414190 [Selaginella moellendorffii]
MAPGFALIGAGGFAKKQYLPLLSTKLMDRVSFKAIWSRSQESAESAVSLIKDRVPEVQPKWGEEGFNDILMDNSIIGVAIVLEPEIQGTYAIQALTAGKHVLQEKPLAPSTQKAQSLVNLYKGLDNDKLVWAIGENYRFEQALAEASKLVKDIGHMVAVEVILESPMNISRPSFSSVWRRQLQGGYIMDSAVHQIAGLRLITGFEIRSVSAISRHVDNALPSPDNVSALIELENGCVGTLMISFSCITKKMSWKVVGTEGTIYVDQDVKDDQPGFLVTCSTSTGKNSVFYPCCGVEEELGAFINDITMGGVPDKRSSPSEAYADVAVIEAILKSNGNVIHV